MSLLQSYVNLLESAEKKEQENESTNAGEPTVVSNDAPELNEVKNDQESNEFQYNDEFSFLSCCASFFRRNWILIFFGTLVGFDIGFWVFLSTGYPQWIGLCMFLGFIISFLIDEILFYSRRNVDGFKWKYIRDLDISKRFEKDEDCNFHVQTDIYSRFCHRYRGGSRVYRKNNCGSLVFQRKYVYFFRDYFGFEIGFSVALHISVFLLFASLFLNIVVFLIALIGVVIIPIAGGLMEWCMRHENIINPLNACITVTKSVPIHEIRHVQCLSIGYHTIRRNRAKQRLGCWYYYVCSSRIIYNICRVFGYFFKLMSVNAAFFLWLLVFLLTATLFLFVVNKGNKALLQFTLTGILIVLFLHIIFLLFLHMPCCGCGHTLRCCNSCKLPKYSILRIPARKQMIFFFLLLASCIAVFIAAVSLSAVNEQLYEAVENATKFEKSIVIADIMVCKADRRRLLTGTLAEELCNSPRKELLIVAVICMCVSWNILLALAFWWYMVDQYCVLRNKLRVDTVWQKYTQVRITRVRSTNSYTLNRNKNDYFNNTGYLYYMFNSIYSIVNDSILNGISLSSIQLPYNGFKFMFNFIRSGIDWKFVPRDIVIELGEEQAMELLKYLADVCPYAQLPSAIGLSCDGSFQYVNRFGPIGGQSYGGDSKDGDIQNPNVKNEANLHVNTSNKNR